MALSGGGDDPAEAAGREASAWFARMHGPDADRSRLDFERWRARSPLNRAAYAEAEQHWQLSAGLAGTDSGRAHLVRAGRRPFLTLPWLAGPGRGAAFAGLAALVLAGSGAWYLWREPQPVPAVARAGELPVATRIGEIRTLRLADGSRVTLDTDSAIETAFTATSRRVLLLRGRARFDVAHDAGRPFLVDAGGRTVIARGTIFDVALDRAGVKVVLLRGAVDIRDARAKVSSAPPLARLVPGQVFADPPVAGAPSVTPAPAGRDAWVDGLLSFDGAPLGAVLEETNRYAAHKIRLGDPALAGLKVTGSFRALPTAALAEVLAATFHLRVETAPEGGFILQRR